MPYIGQVATLCRLPNVKNAGLGQCMSRRRHIMKVAVSSFKILVSNFFVAQSTNVETPTGGTASITAAIEYPAGVFTQVTFKAGQVTASLLSGDLCMSDLINLAIPAGTAFWVRMFFQNAVGGIAYTDTTTQGAVEDTANGDAFTYAASGLSDQTMGGTVTNTAGAGVGYYGLSCNAIVGYTSQPSCFLMGDSRTGGQADTPDDATGDIGETGRAVGANWAYINAGIGAGRLQNWVKNNQRQLYIASFCSHVINQYGEADIVNDGRTAAQLIADVQTARNFFAERPFFQTTLIIESTSTNSWADLANQTTVAQNSVTQTFNTAVRAGITDVTGFFDDASVLESGTTGKWVVNGAAFYSTIDGVHQTPAGNKLVRDGGLYTAAKIHL